MAWLEANPPSEEELEGVRQAIAEDEALEAAGVPALGIEELRERVKKRISERATKKEKVKV